MAQLGRRVKQIVRWTICSQSPRGFMPREGEPRALPTVIDTYSGRKRKQQLNSIKRGGMAQLVERRVRNAEARGSNPLTSTTWNRGRTRGSFSFA